MFIFFSNIVFPKHSSTTSHPKRESWRTPSTASLPGSQLCQRAPCPLQACATPLLSEPRPSSPASATYAEWPLRLLGPLSELCRSVSPPRATRQSAAFHHICLSKLGSKVEIHKAWARLMSLDLSCTMYIKDSKFTLALFTFTFDSFPVHLDYIGCLHLHIYYVILMCWIDSL